RQGARALVRVSSLSCPGFYATWREGFVGRTVKNVWEVVISAVAPPARQCYSRPSREPSVSRVKKERGVLHVKLFGGFETHLATGAPVRLPRKGQALLASLAVRPGQAHARDKLATLLWADRGDAQARDSLRHTLVELRKVFPEQSPSLIGE